MAPHFSATKLRILGTEGDVVSRYGLSGLVAIMDGDISLA
jgi:hypothetical protein